MQSYFLDFRPLEKQQWKEQVIKDLKGKPYESLLWKLPEGFELEPYYTAEELKKLSPPTILNPPPTIPGGEPRQWVNLQYLHVQDIESANKQALEALNGGATGLLFDLRTLKDLPDFYVLLKGILLQHCVVSFQVEAVGHQVLVAYLQYVKQQGHRPEELQGFIAFDPLGYLSQTGLMDNDRLREWARMAEMTLVYPALRGVMLDSGTYHNAGASAVQEIAFLLSLTAEYLHRLTELGAAPADVFSNLGFSVALGSRYFVEIAKLRALRLLVAAMAQAYGLKDYAPTDVYIHTYTGRWSKSRLDVNTNLLRNTTEAMSGILGGCNALTVMPHDAVLGKADGFSQRMARNISTILQEEAYLGKVQDPVAGAYYPEILTHKLAEESWELFLALEQEGSYAKLVEKGRMSELIEGTRKLQNFEVAMRRQRIVGVNTYSNPLEELYLPAKLRKIDADGMLLKQLGQADVYEALRERTQHYKNKEGRSPRALLLQFGDPTMRRARAAFAADFLQTAGIVSTEKVLQEDESPIALLSADGPEIIVLCAADEDYNQQVVWLSDQLRQGYSGVLLVAGNPETLAADVKHAAMDGFIHLKSNTIKVLTEVQDKIFFAHEA